MAQGSTCQSAKAAIPGSNLLQHKYILGRCRFLVKYCNNLRAEGKSQKIKHKKQKNFGLIFSGDEGLH